jgi:hypothetical protein
MTRRRLTPFLAGRIVQAFADGMSVPEIAYWMRLSRRPEGREMDRIMFVCEKCGHRAELANDVPVYLDQGMLSKPCGGVMRPAPDGGTPREEA